MNQMGRSRTMNEPNEKKLNAPISTPSYCFFQDCLEALVNHYLEATVLHKQGNQINPINRTEVDRGVCFNNWKKKKWKSKVKFFHTY